MVAQRSKKITINKKAKSKEWVLQTNVECGGEEGFERMVTDDVHGGL